MVGGDRYHIILAVKAYSSLLEFGTCFWGLIYINKSTLPIAHQTVLQPIDYGNLGDLFQQSHHEKKLQKLEFEYGNGKVWTYKRGHRNG